MLVMIYFFLGLILGILIRDIKVLTVKEVERIKEWKEVEEMKGKTQFIEPISPRETIDKIFKNE